MKIKKIVDIGKRHRAIRIYDERDREGNVVMQWLNAGRAIYPLYGAPRFDEISLAKTYDIKADKVSIDREDAKETLCFKDATEDESAVVCIDTLLCVGGVTLYPYITQQGIAFIDEESLSPFGGQFEDVCVYERYTPGRQMYFAVKRGFELAALIMPYQSAVSPKLLGDLKALRNLTELALSNREAGI